MLARNLKSNLSTTVSVILAVLIFLAVNLSSVELLARFRLDLTENKLYTLSEQTVSTLQSLTEPISMSLFISRSELLQIPGISTFAGRVEDLLREFERLSNGSISFRMVDPRPFSESEDAAVGYGLQGIPLQSGSTLYFGLVATNSTDGIQVIPQILLEREELLEYDLIRLLVQLDGRVRKKIGLISSLPIQGTGGFPAGSTPQQAPWTFFLQMNEIFEVEMLSPSIDSLPDDIEMLFLLHPRTFSSKLLYEIDQFVLKGNSLLLVVDPFSEILSAILGTAQLKDLDTSSDLNLLTEHWGVTIQPGKIVGDLPISARVLEGDGSSGRTINYPVWMNIQPEQLNPLDVVTSKLGNLIFATAGVLEINSGLATEITPLIRTSESAKLYDVGTFNSVSSIRELLEGYEEGNQKWPMAARIRGRASTAFQNGPPTEENELSTGVNSEHLASGEIDVIMIADTDFLHDRFWVRAQQSFGQTLLYAEASNGELINNALDNLSGDNRLLGIRTRGRSFRPFVLTQRIRQEAEQKYLQHEKQLQEELQRVEEFLANFVQEEGDTSAEIIITDEQRQEVKRLRETHLSIRRQLREVQHNLVKDIQQLENRLVLLNLLVVPLLLAIAGASICTVGVRRRDRRLALRISENLR